MGLLMTVVAEPVPTVDEGLDFSGMRTVTCYEAGEDRFGGTESLAPRPRIQKDGSRTLKKVVVDPGDRKLRKG